MKLYIALRLPPVHNLPFEPFYANFIGNMFYFQNFAELWHKSLFVLN